MPPSAATSSLAIQAPTPVRVELLVPRAVQRVGEVDALAVPADLDHLRAAAERLVRPGRVRRRAPTMPPIRTEPVSTGCSGSETSYCLSSPVPQHDTYRYLSSTDRSMSVISGGTAPKPCSSGGSWSAGAGSAGMVITLVAAHWPLSSCHIQIEADRSSTLTTTPTKPYFLVGSCAGPQLERHLVLVAEVHGLDAACASFMSQKCSRWPYLRPSSSSGTTPSSIMDGRAPLRGDGDVGHARATTRRKRGTGRRGRLRTAPSTSNAVLVEQRDAARTFLAVAAEAGHEHGARAAVHGVRAGVAGPLAEFVGVEHLDHRRRGRVRLGVQDVHARGPDPRDDQVAAAAVDRAPPPGRSALEHAFQPKWCSSSPRCGSSVKPTTEPYAGRVRVHVHHRDRVGLVRRPGERRRRRRASPAAPAAASRGVR